MVGFPHDSALDVSHDVCISPQFVRRPQAALQGERCIKLNVLGMAQGQMTVFP
jgi:hypothetical protein